MPATPLCWDIFCSVVDNYGDVGVAWRVARQLARDHALDVRLFVDALPALARLAPGIDASAEAQQEEGVEVRRWHGPSAGLEAAPRDVVIEAFGCGLPETYLAKLASRAPQPVWVNLEYLSAESWIEGCHGLASRHPRLPLTRCFFFPGFTAESGGLLRERGLLEHRDRFRNDAEERAALWRRLGVTPPAPRTRVVSLFCYPNAALPSLLDAWAGDDAPLLCLAPEGVASAELERWTGGIAFGVGTELTRGSLSLAGIPFVAQDDYDRVLWACDLNFVRGEDSFVRAQWAGRPMIWHAYPQAENAHRLKLDAFLARYAAGLAEEPAGALSGLSTAWNGGNDVGAAWRRFAPALHDLCSHARTWSDALSRQRDLATGLVKFCSDRV